MSTKCIKSVLILLTVYLVGGCGSSDSDNESGQSFHGYDCSDDCSGHEAGYEWASDNDITDIDDCDSNSDSFNEGCSAFVEEN